METNLPPSGRALRRYLTDVLVTDSDLNAFCLDYYPAIHRTFANGMDRPAKLDLLLGKADVAQLLRNVEDAEPERARRFAHLLLAATAAASEPPPVPPPPAQVYTREELLSRLCRLQPVQFDEVVFFMGLNAAESAPEILPQKKRAIELIKQVEQKGAEALQKLSALLPA